MSKYDAAQFSSVCGNPSFESAGCNRIAIIPLMANSYDDSQKQNNQQQTNQSFRSYRNHSEQSFQYLMNCLKEFSKRSTNTSIPNSSPTNPNSTKDKTTSLQIDTNDQSKLATESSSSSSSTTTTSSSSSSYTWKQETNSNTILVIPNLHLTRPGDWRYDHTPLTCFDWTKGCQRFHLFDGRPDFSRMAHDSMVNPTSQKWGDLIPSRQTMAVIGVLNCKDCPNTEVLLKAKEELEKWSMMYYSPPFVENNGSVGDPINLPAASSSSPITTRRKSTTATGGGGGDINSGPPRILLRMFVFDSFDERCQTNLDFTSTNLGPNLVAFPPAEGPQGGMMDEHLNVVMNDLAVAIFRRNEAKIAQVDEFAKSSATFKFQFPSLPFGPNNVGGGVGGSLLKTLEVLDGKHDGAETIATTSTGASSNASMEKSNKLGFTLKAAMDRALTNATSPRTSSSTTSSSMNEPNNNSKNLMKPKRPKTPQSLSSSSSHSATTIPHFLFTPLDTIPSDFRKLTPKDHEAFKKQQLGRREKLAGDYCLLAGSPLDAYERYSHAMEMSKTAHDPLWYASSVEGCATAYIAMADAGGHSVDEYLDHHFKLPEEVMALAVSASRMHNAAEHKKNQALDRTKTTLPAAILTLADEALAIYCRHEKCAALYAELLMKLAAYTADKEEAHLHCQWGVGEGCYAGDGGSKAFKSPTNPNLDHPPPPISYSTSSSRPNHANNTSTTRHNRWEHSLKSHLSLGNLGAKGKEYSLLSSLSRSQRCADLLQRAVSTGSLDPRTRADIAVTCARICLRGVQSSHWGDFHQGTSQTKSRMRFPRKAAFLTLIAAEAMTQCAQIDQRQESRATSLWLAAAHLYAREENGVAGSGNYGWATLRASALHGLSQRNGWIGGLESEQAAELLILLLSEISPDRSELKMNAVLNEDESTAVGGGIGGGSGGPGGVLGGALAGGPLGGGGESLVALDAEIKLGDGDIGGSGSSMMKSSEVPNEVKEIANMTANKIKNARKHTLTTKGPFFMQMAPSTYILTQSKWLENDPIPDVNLPLLDNTSKLVDSILQNSSHSDMITKNIEYSLANSAPMLSLNCIVSQVQFETCANAQSKYISDLINMRTRMPTSTHQKGKSAFSIYGANKQTNHQKPSMPQSKRSNSISTSSNVKKNSTSPNHQATTIPPPLHVISASIIKSESNLLLERTKAAGYSKVTSASMATFFNPYDNKRKEEEKKPLQITLVAEGEERIIVVVFSNLLSVPLEVPSCHLEFDRGKKEDNNKIEAPPLSFTIPAKSKEFAVRFPFIVLATPQQKNKLNRNQSTNPNSSTSLDTSLTVNGGNEEKPNIFELMGVRITCMNRPYFISFSDKKNEKNAKSTHQLIHRQLPNPASVYPLTNHTKQKLTKDQVSVKVESVPAQPNLLVSFTTSLTPMEDNATVPVHLSDGEIYTIPPLRLENNFGSSGLGKMERLQIICVGLPGLQDEILFDTDKEAAARGEDVFLDSESDVGSSDDFEELMEYDGLPPLKMKANTEGLSLESINEKSKSHEGSVVTFQIAATHDMGNSLANGGHVRIRFRYRGPSPNPATEIWRRREISLRILRVKGPRISSLSFRSDLSWGSVFSQLSQSLAYQKLRRLSQPKTEAIAKEIFRKSLCRTMIAEDVEISLQTELAKIDGKEEEEPNDNYVLEQVGMDQGVHVSGDEVVVLMAVANETNNTIVLSNRKGRVGGFEASPMSTVRVTSGVSVKIPVVIQRIDRRDENGNIADIAAELIARTALQWESEVSDGEQKENKRLRQGRVRIPSRCLREIIGEHHSFASRICESPVTVDIDIGRRQDAKAVQIFPGYFIDANMKVNIRDWIPNHVIAKCTLVFEFCCAKKDDSGPSYYDDNNPAYIWCGQIRRIVRNGSGKLKESLSHRARISFIQSGTYVVSACVKIIAEGQSCEEIWWAPRTETVIVMKMNQ